jgi:hypothetical protein
MGAKISFSGEVVKHEEVRVLRRRNSLAYNISKFITYDEDDMTPVLIEVRMEKAKQVFEKPKFSKYTKIGDTILQGFSFIP